MESSLHGTQSPWTGPHTARPAQIRPYRKAQKFVLSPLPADDRYVRAFQFSCDRAASRVGSPHLIPHTSYFFFSYKKKSKHPNVTFRVYAPTNRRSGREVEKVRFQIFRENRAECFLPRRRGSVTKINMKTSSFSLRVMRRVSVSAARRVTGCQRHRCYGRPHPE
ncbi:hypothetical protein EVAR_76706_1 [Eumeta japonica]|uniref:Uncharacterized protein n=1 Tax=Eumeta variegata TaxID=151549 RepID=A0A4C1SSY1_EUMVA|nr:hypothetical protein EVAR_76706_1 [Eumeta japonica]